jgi:hypothetical protein
MPTLVVKPNKCSVSIASARATIDHKAYDAVISNTGFVNSGLGDFTADRRTVWMSIYSSPTTFSPSATATSRW